VNDPLLLYPKWIHPLRVSDHVLQALETPNATIDDHDVMSFLPFYDHVDDVHDLTRYQKPMMMMMMLLLLLTIHWQMSRSHVVVSFYLCSLVP
jgi:hypothetical protein